MPGQISLPSININPGIGGSSIPQQNPLGDAGQAFIQTFLASQGQKRADSRSSAEQEIQKAHLALAQKEMDFKIAEMKHRAEVAKQQGEASNLYLEHALPIAAATGQLGQMNPMQGVGDQGAGMAAGPAMQQGMQSLPQGQGVAAQGPDQYRQFLSSMDPEALIGFVKNVLPVLQSVKQQEQRDKIAQQYPEVPNETTPQTLNRFRKLSAAYANAGDHAMVASLAEATGVLTPPRDQYEWFQTKDGKTVYLPKEEGSRQRLGKPIGSQTGFGFGPGGPMGVIRAISAIDGMKDADQKMRPYEINLAGGQVSLTDKDYFQGHLTQLYNDATKEAGIVGHIVPFFGTAAGTQMMERLNKTNPDYANYLQAASQWALEESLLSNRPSDFRVKMDEFISAVKIGAGKKSIHELWRSRSVRLNALERGKPTLQRLLDRAASMPNIPGTQIVPDAESP